MLIKYGVYGADRLHPAIIMKAFPAVVAIWGDSEPVITSVSEGTHKASSKHYFGCAVDFRLPRFYKVRFDKLKEKLEKDGMFTVVLSPNADKPLCIHVQYNLKI